MLDIILDGDGFFKIDAKFSGKYELNYMILKTKIWEAFFNTGSLLSSEIKNEIKDFYMKSRYRMDKDLKWWQLIENAFILSDNEARELATYVYKNLQEVENIEALLHVSVKLYYFSTFLQGFPSQKELEEELLKIGKDVIKKETELNKKLVITSDSRRGGNRYSKMYPIENRDRDDLVTFFNTLFEEFVKIAEEEYETTCVHVPIINALNHLEKNDLSGLEELNNYMEENYLLSVCFSITPVEKMLVVIENLSNEKKMQLDNKLWNYYRILEKHSRTSNLTSIIMKKEIEWFKELCKLISEKYPYGTKGELRDYLMSTQFKQLLKDLEKEYPRFFEVKPEN